jgi:hypothetical protein
MKERSEAKEALREKKKGRKKKTKGMSREMKDGGNMI